MTKCENNEFGENVSVIRDSEAVQAAKQSGINLDTANMQAQNSGLKTVWVDLKRLDLDSVKQKCQVPKPSNFRTFGRNSTNVRTVKRKAAVNAAVAVKKIVALEIQSEINSNRAPLPKYKFICNVCWKNFSRRRALKLHLAQQHSCQIAFKRLRLNAAKQNLITFPLTSKSGKNNFDCSGKVEVAIVDDDAVEKIVPLEIEKPNWNSETDIDYETFTSDTDADSDDSYISISDEDKSEYEMIVKPISAAKYKFAKCNICKKSFVRRSALKLHLAKEHVVHNSFKRKKLFKIAARFKCNCCEFSCNFVKQFSSHIFKTGHVIERTTCSKTSPKTLHLKSQKFKLHKSKIYSNYILLQNPLHNKKTLACKMCENSKRRKRKYYPTCRFRLLHTTNSRFHECKICNKSFSSVASFKEHFEAHSAENYGCTICGKQCKRKYFLRCRRPDNLRKNSAWQKKF